MCFHHHSKTIALQTQWKHGIHNSCKAHSQKAFLRQANFTNNLLNLFYGSYGSKNGLLISISHGCCWTKHNIFIPLNWFVWTHWAIGQSIKWSRCVLNYTLSLGFIVLFLFLSFTLQHCAIHLIINFVASVLAKLYVDKQRQWATKLSMLIILFLSLSISCNRQHIFHAKYLPNWTKSATIWLAKTKLLFVPIFRRRCWLALFCVSLQFF